MSNEENNIIEIVDEDGNVLKCELYDIIEFEDKPYALLVNTESIEDEPELVIMRYIEEGDDVFFETIDDDDEFERISEYISTLDDEDSEE